MGKTPNSKSKEGSVLIIEVFRGYYWKNIDGVGQAP